MSNTSDEIALRLYRLKYNQLNDLSKEFVDDVVQLIDRARVEGRIEASTYFKKYMMNASPFISEILDPYLELQANLTKKEA